MEHDSPEGDDFFPSIDYLEGTFEIRKDPGYPDAHMFIFKCRDIEIAVSASMTALQIFGLLDDTFRARNAGYLKQAVKVDDLKIDDITLERLLENPDNER